MEIRLYHSTLDSNLESIAENGICLNRAKAGRELKSFTDLFNHVFNQTYKGYIPQRVNLNYLIDRNESIFLSAFQEEFRKSEHPMVKGEKVEGRDIVYECVFDHDLPAFDAMVYENYCDILKRMLDIPLINDYFEQSKLNEKEAFSNLIKYFITGDYKLLCQKEEKEEEFEDIRKRVIKFTEQAVKRYCEKAVNASDIVSRYGSYKKNGKYHWMKNKGAEKDLPVLIVNLEILCNRDIKENFSLLEAGK